MGKMKDVLIGAAERLASEKKISVDTAEDLIRNGEVFGDKDMKWIADYAEEKEEKEEKMVEQKIVIDVPTEKDAMIIKDALTEIIRKYGYARTVSLYEIIEKHDIDFPKVRVYVADYEHGWTREEDITYRGNDSDGWQVVLPIPETIKPQKSTEEKKHDTVKIYLLMENDPYWSSPELNGVEIDRDEAMDTVYDDAYELFKQCVREDHRPTLTQECNHYKVDDDEGDIHRDFYVVEREVEIC